MRPLATMLLVLFLAGCGGLPAPLTDSPTATPEPAPPATPTPDPPTAVATPAAAASPPASVAASPTPAMVAPMQSPTARPFPTVLPPRPTATPIPTTPTPSFQPVRQTLGPIPGARGEEYTVEITLTNAWYSPGDRNNQPAPGTAFLIVEVEVRNLGPATMRHLNSFDFVALDEDRAVRPARPLGTTRDCQLELVELLPGGRVRACFGYQVLERGAIEFIYVPAPLRAEGLKPGRYLSFPLPPARP